MRRSVSTPVEGTRCMVVGWGYTQGVRFLPFYLFFLSNSSFLIIVHFQQIFNHHQDEDSDISSTLLKTDVDVIDVNFCNGSYSYAGAMMPGMFCAGKKREGSFQFQNNYTESNSS